jgi:hypothetical protein
MRVVIAGLSIALAACASAGVSPTPVGARQSVTVATPTGTIELASSGEAAVTVNTIAAPVDRVWAALPGVYDSLGIPIATANSSTHLVGIQALKVRQRLGKAYLSKYIDCGESQIGASADTYDVVLTIFTQVLTADGGATKVSTSLDAVAKPPAFSQSYSHCSSKSVLEHAIADQLRARAAR